MAATSSSAPSYSTGTDSSDHEVAVDDTQSNSLVSRVLQQHGDILEILRQECADSAMKLKDDVPHLIERM